VHVHLHLVGGALDLHLADSRLAQLLLHVLAQLAYVEKRAALPLAKLLRSAVANADQASKGQVDVDQLYVKELQVGQGPSLRRFMPRAMGRAFKVLKKTSHVSIVVGDEVPTRKKKPAKRKAGAAKAQAQAKG